jgi:PTS system N-acetylgalactosamine-specific IIA component
MSSESTAPAAGERPRAIVMGHGDFATGLISAVEQITGRGRVLLPLAVKQLGVEDIESQLRERMLASGIRVIFTDLQAGSCTMASRKILRGMDDAVLVAGANLPTLLDFVFADTVPPVEAARHAAERGKASITAVGGVPK